MIYPSALTGPPLPNGPIADEHLQNAEQIEREVSRQSPGEPFLKIERPGCAADVQHQHCRDVRLSPAAMSGGAPPREKRRWPDEENREISKKLVDEKQG